MWTKRRAGRAGWAAGVLLLGVAVALGAAPPSPKSPRLYIFDCGVIKGLGVDLFGFKAGEVPPRDFFVPCYLVVHPKGTLMWDVGVIPDSQVNGTTQGISIVTKTLKS